MFENYYHHRHRNYGFKEDGVHKRRKTTIKYHKPLIQLCVVNHILSSHPVQYV